MTIIYIIHIIIVSIIKPYVAKLKFKLTVFHFKKQKPKPTHIHTRKKIYTIFREEMQHHIWNVIESDVMLSIQQLH